MIEVLTSIAAGLLVWRLGCIADAMNGTTDHLMRTALVLLIVGAFGVCLGPLYPEDRGWATLLFLVGAVAWMFTERRGRWL